MNPKFYKQQLSHWSLCNIQRHRIIDLLWTCELCYSSCKILHCLVISMILYNTEHLPYAATTILPISSRNYYKITEVHVKSSTNCVWCNMNYDKPIYNIWVIKVRVSNLISTIKRGADRTAMLKPLTKSLAAVVLHFQVDVCLMVNSWRCTLSGVGTLHQSHFKRLSQYLVNSNQQTKFL